MSTSQTPSPTASVAQEILKNIADLLCPAHKHGISAPQITPGLPKLHSMVIGCSQESDIKWQVGMSADFLVKVIRRCKVLSDCKFLCPHRPNILSQNSAGALTRENGYSTPRPRGCDYLCTFQYLGRAPVWGHPLASWHWTSQGRLMGG